MDIKLQNTINILPQDPGVYQFFNDKGKRLYIGKAKNLHSRVRSYFAISAELTPAKQRMVSQIHKIEYTVTDNELEALLLETNLIKEHKPLYNVVLKDDKYWQYIKIDFDNYWPQIYATRRPDFRRKTKSIYFGPYTSGFAVKESIRLIKKIFPLCLKTPKTKKSKPQPCFNYHLGRCLGPCVNETNPAEYARVFEDIKKFLRGSRLQLTDKLKNKMQTYSQSRHYEAAGRVRDQIKALKKLESRQKVVTQSQDNIDIVSLYQEEGRNAVNLFKVRQGKLLDKFNTLIKTTKASQEEIIEAFINQYYIATTDIPKSIVTNLKLSTNNVLNIPIQITQRGKKLQLVKLGAINAKEFLKQQETFFDRSARLVVNQKRALAELKNVLKLKTLPKRIETYDISNIQGQLAVGSMVIFENGQPKKTDYRKFNIRLKQTPDDVHMMHEVILRRLRQLGKKNNKFSNTPNLIVVDGGKTQLNAALRAQQDLNLNIPIISLAKKLEKIYVPGHKTPLSLSKQSPALQLLQQGRDEAHRFAITAYRRRHGKQTMASVLDEIPGIGKKTKELLIKKYKSPGTIKNVSQKDLAKLIGRQKAQIIKDSL